MENGKKRVVCVGLVCLDIVAEKKGFPIEDTDQRVTELEYRRGGNASNSSSVLAQLGLESEFLGNLAGSMELSFIKEDFSNYGISIEHCPVEKHCAFPTSIVILNSLTGSRTILHHSKNLQELSYEHFKALDLNNYAWVHFEGRSTNLTNLKQMIERARNQQPSDLKISIEIEKTRGVLHDLLPLGDVMFVSKEYSMFCGYHTKAEAVQKFLPQIKPGAIVVCAWGSDGAAAGQNDQVITQDALPPDQVVDTLGAGDTFNAAFIYGQINRMDLKKSLELACLIAGCKVGQNGFKGIGQFKLELQL